MASRIIAPPATLPAGLAPVGALVPYAGAAAPSGWLLCDGTSYLRTTYPDLFTVIGTTYGAVDGTHFSVPDLRRRFALGKGAADALGDAAGTFGHTHAITQPADHASQVHSGTAVAAHVVTQPNAHANHVSTQANAHANHVTTQPAAHADNIAHTHGLNVQGGTTAAVTGTHVMTSTATGGSARAITAGDAGLSSGTGASLVHSGTGVDAHSVHAGAAVDAHSAHAGTAVDAHGVTQPTAHPILTHAGASAGTADPPYLVLNYLVRAA